MHQHFIAILVVITEVVTGGLAFDFLLDDDTLFDIRRQEEVFGLAQEDFVRFTMQFADEGDPLLIVVLETHHVAFEFLRTLRCSRFADVVGTGTAVSFRSLFFLLFGHQYSVT